MKRPRDQQRSRVYASDNSTRPWNRPLETVDDVKAFAEKLFASDFISNRYAGLLGWPLKIKDGRGTRIARGGINYISIPKWARNTTIVCHELAHTLTMRKYGPTKYAAHGPEFAGIYIDVVLAGIGHQAAQALKEAFAQNRVKYVFF